MLELGTTQKGSGLAFGDVVGQAGFKEALLAVAAAPDLSGLLVRGGKGTAKSTTVRALADLLPEQRAVADCPYGCHPDDATQQCRDCRERADPPVERRAVPLVTLPLGATRDRVVGTLSVADALDGEQSFDPGLLARANRGLLYVDEVNLLDDHLVDVLLDAAASGVNRVERDGVSHAHPAAFTLVGTMNPEEGDLRPQLRDRFDLQVTVSACEDLDRRVAVIDRALGADGELGAAPPETTRGLPTDDTAAARERLRAAGRRLAADEVTLPREFARLAAEIPRDAGVEGHRGDIAIARTARALAALHERESVVESDVERAAELALPHRLTSQPFEEGPSIDEVLDEQFGDDGEGDRNGEAGSEDGERGGDGEGSADGDDSGEDRSGDQEGGEGNEEKAADAGDGEDRGRGQAGASGDDDAAPADGPAGADSENGDERDGDRTAGPATASADGSGAAGAGGDDDDRGEADGAGAGDPTDADGERPLIPGADRAGIGAAAAPETAPPAAEGGDGAGGRAAGGERVGGSGARVRTERAERDVDPAASVRAAARRGGSDIQRRDLRSSVRADDADVLVLFVLDASASMRPAMCEAKGVVMELLEEAYEQRDAVGVVTFAGTDADVVLPPTDSVALAARHLKDVPTGDRTPLPTGLQAASTVLERADPAASVVVLLTDGKANAAADPTAATRAAARGLAAHDPEVLVVDAGEGERAGLVDLLVSVTDGRHLPLSALTAARVDGAADTS